ncbi:hypothetical protein C8Q79DRAFT_1011067 [Trametes meyenii]|nr:hypothetical protein C8Q79DRAFT_1011067 [Trametes meyenii]
MLQDDDPLRTLTLQVFTRDPTVTEWEYFQQYARRVRELHVLPPPETSDSTSAGNKTTIVKGISPSAWTILSRRCGRGGICPHLTYLSLLTSPSDPGQLVLISPALRHLHIAFGKYLDLTQTVALRGLLSCLLSVFAPLESLRLGKKPPLIFTRSPLCLSYWIALKPTLGSLNLQELNIGLEVFEENPSHTPGAFPSMLRKLNVKGPSSTISRFVEYAAGSDLESLALIFDDAPLPPGVMLLEDFARAAECLTQSARRFIVMFVSQAADRTIPFPDIHDILSPLFLAGSLTDISIRFIGMCAVLHGGDLWNIANAWPQLNGLHIE